MPDRYGGQLTKSFSRGQVLAQMCGIGLGIAVLPRPVGDQIGTIRRLELSEEPPHREMWMGYHRDLRRLHRLRAFVDIVIKHLAN